MEGLILIGLLLAVGAAAFASWFVIWGNDVRQALQVIARACEGSGDPGTAHTPSGGDAISGA